MSTDFRQTYIQRAMDDIEKVLETFQWANGVRRDQNRGEIHVDRDQQKLVLEVWVADNEDPEDDSVKPLNVSVDIDYHAPWDQIRGIIHQFLCHEADEQMWFGEERPFHPHQENNNGN